MQKLLFYLASATALAFATVSPFIGMELGRALFQVVYG